MTPASILFFAALVLATSFLSGVFGMAGGMILMGALVFLMPVPTAMVLHGITQMTSNGWRALVWRRYVHWSIVLRYVAGLALAALLFLLLRFVPDERIVLLALGLMPFVALAVPERLVPQAEKRGGAELCGFLCTALQLLSGISGPALDLFFLKGKMDRRAVVATKATCQTLTHLVKLLYFGLLVGGAEAGYLEPLVVGLAVGLAMLGTTLSRSVLERLSDQGFRRYTQWIVMAIGAVYLTRGVLAFF